MIDNFKSIGHIIILSTISVLIGLYLLTILVPVNIVVALFGGKQRSLKLIIDTLQQIPTPRPSINHKK